ncbi:uncharacterized protein [Oryctolagus cuniculus]|uniref:uncharacterized protein n=1 Tax=Oryctolagus cuniculus TaxID=9986 RepID=UPI00222EFD7F|nr:uncharacterized protein LOC127485307 [Oryctolagus cuniculus]
MTKWDLPQCRELPDPDALSVGGGPVAAPGDPPPSVCLHRNASQTLLGTALTARTWGGGHKDLESRSPGSTPGGPGPTGLGQYPPVCGSEWSQPPHHSGVGLRPGEEGFTAIPGLCSVASSPARPPVLKTPSHLLPQWHLPASPFGGIIRNQNARQEEPKGQCSWLGQALRLQEQGPGPLPPLWALQGWTGQGEESSIQAGGGLSGASWKPLAESQLSQCQGRGQAEPGHLPASCSRRRSSCSAGTLPTAQPPAAFSGLGPARHNQLPERCPRPRLNGDPARCNRRSVTFIHGFKPGGGLVCVLIIGKRSPPLL